MKIWLVGDIHGCYHTWLRLWERMDLGPKDRVIVLGDAVNKGKYSLEVLRHLYTHDCICLMGNHELFWLSATHQGSWTAAMRAWRHAPDRDTLSDWMRSWHWLYYLEEHHALMVHAGLPSDWRLPELLAMDVTLRNSATSPDFIEKSRRYDSSDPGACLAWTLTHIRYLDAHGQPHAETKAPPQAGLRPWYDVCTLPCHIYFGHWAHLQGRSVHPQRTPLDGAAVYGHALLAYELTTQTRMAQDFDPRDCDDPC